MKVKEFKKCKNCWKEFKIFSTTDKFCKVWCMKEFEANKKRKVKEKKKVSISTLTKVLDVVFSQYIRLRDCIETTWTTTHLKCFICWELIEYNKSQNMHFLPRWHKIFRWHTWNCHWWCYTCNVAKHWNYIEYFYKMEEKFWREFVNYLRENKNMTYKLTPDLLQSEIEFYKKQIKILELKN